MSNSIFSIHPYRPYSSSNGWVFDDPGTGLKAEAFVAGIPEMMNLAITEWNIPDDKLVCHFSAGKIPGKNVVHLQWISEEHGGNWYVWEEKELVGWFCPALFKYFPEAPKNLYIQFVEG
jgi:hypothetical protein